MIVAGLAMVQESSVDELTHADLLAQMDRLKSVVWALPALEHRMLARLAAEASPAELGGTSLANVLTTRLRISKGEAQRRIKHGELLGPQRALTGEPLPPKLPNVAAAQRRGDIGAEHVAVIERFFDQLPARIDYQTRGAAEADLARIAAGLGPTQLRKAADRLAALIDQDGVEPTDADRARKRYLTIERQARDGTSKVHGLLDPQARATLEAVLGKWAAPGMCNPDDQSPCVTGTPSRAAIQGDTRSLSQRNVARFRVEAMPRPAWQNGPTPELLGHCHVRTGLRHEVGQLLGADQAPYVEHAQVIEPLRRLGVGELSSAISHIPPPRWAAPCRPPGSWAATTACRAPLSCPPRSRNSNPGAATR